MARPNPYYVRAGDVVRVQINLKWANFAYGSNTSNDFKNAVANSTHNGGFAVMGFNDSAVSTFTGGAMYIDVMPRGDYNNVQDVAGLMGGIATNAGFSVDSAAGQIISYVENTGGAAPPPGPLNPFQNPGVGGINDYLRQWGISPTAALVGVVFFVFVLPRLRD